MRLRAVGGSGGKGSVSSDRLGRKHNLRPDGGHGGRGGSVLIVADPTISSLNASGPHISADDGTHGGKQKKNGRAGKNVIFRVPCGVLVRRVLDYDEVWDPVNNLAIKVKEDEEGDQDQGMVHEEYEIGAITRDAQGYQRPYQWENLDDPDEYIDSSKAGNRHNKSKGGAYDDGESSEYTNHDEESQAPFNQSDDMWSEQVPLDLTGKKGIDPYNTEVDDSEDVMASSTEDFLSATGRDTVLVGDLDKPGSHVLVAMGGKEGRGSGSYASSSGPPPDAMELVARARPGQGEVAYLELELKLIADVGLVGFPNAGKSSLLRAMSRATPAIAPYLFTTLHPLLGCIEYKDGRNILAADVPGLVEGASEGRGRGHDFLRHLERTKSLLYIVDAAGVDGRDPVEDLRVLTNELLCYGEGDMLSKPALVVANKFDLLDEVERESIMFELGMVAEEAGIQFNGDVLGISAGVTGHGLGSLSRAMRDMVVESENEKIIEDEQSSV